MECDRTGMKMRSVRPEVFTNGSWFRLLCLIDDNGVLGQRGQQSSTTQAQDGTRQYGYYAQHAQHRTTRATRHKDSTARHSMAQRNTQHHGGHPSIHLSPFTHPPFASITSLSPPHPSMHPTSPLPKGKEKATGTRQALNRDPSVGSSQVVGWCRMAPQLDRLASLFSVHSRSSRERLTSSPLAVGHSAKRM